MSLPNDWQQRPLRELTARTATWNPQREARDRIRYVDVSGVDRATLSIVAETSYSAAEAPSRARKIVQNGDTIFATVRPTLRRIAQVPAALDGEIVSTAFCVLRPDRDQIDPDFLFFAAQLESVMSGISVLETGASYPAVRDSDVLDQVIPVPPPAEQQKIAEALKATRAALLHESECEAQAAALKGAATRTLFTRGLRGKPQKETEIGSVPDGWIKMPISSLGQVITGNTPPTKDQANYVGGDIPFIAPGDFEHGTAITLTEKLITQKGLATSRPIKAGVTCFVCIGSTIGKVGYTRAAICATNQQINSIIPNEKFVPLFVFYLMTYWSDYVRKQASPSPVPILSKGAFERIEIFTSMDEDEQREIATILDVIDRKIELHQRKRAVLDALFKSLLHKLMTGAIQVSDLDLSVLSVPKIAEAAT